VFVHTAAGNVGVGQMVNYRLVSGLWPQRAWGNIIYWKI